MVRPCDEKRRATYSQESDDEGYTKKKIESTTENKMESCMPTRVESIRLRDEQGDM